MGKISSILSDFHPFNPKVGLALGGGGAKAVGHLGVLKALEERNQSVHCIAGTSAGAFVAALYAFGKNPDEIKKIFTSLTLGKLGVLTLGSGGVLTGSNISSLLIETLGPVDIADAQIPLAIVCCDLVSGRNVIFKEGPLAKLVQASSAFPGLFAPVEHEDMMLVDGFLTENVPVSAVRSLGARFVVSVRLSTGTKPYSIEKVGIIDVLNRSFDILVDRPSDVIQREVSYAIELDLSFVDRFKITDPERAVFIGYQEGSKLFSMPLFFYNIMPFINYLKRSWVSFIRLVVTLFGLGNSRLQALLLRKNNHPDYSSKTIDNSSKEPTNNNE